MLWHKWIYLSPLQSDDAFQIFSTCLSLLIYSGMHVSSDRSALMAEPTESVKRHQKITIRSLFSTNNAIHFQTSRNAKQIYILKKNPIPKSTKQANKKSPKAYPKTGGKLRDKWNTARQPELRIYVHFMDMSSNFKLFINYMWKDSWEISSERELTWWFIYCCSKKWHSYTYVYIYMNMHVYIGEAEYTHDGMSYAKLILAKFCFPSRQGKCSEIWVTLQPTLYHPCFRIYEFCLLDNLC